MSRKGGGRSSAQPAADESAGEAVAAAGRQRIDRWLWHARLVRTRSDAASLTAAGHVRVNGTRIDAPGRMVRLGDVVTVALDRAVRVLRVRGFAERRGSAGGNQDLYEELAEGR
jgi:ribosome-associated heat shock protein Hsp15